MCYEEISMSNAIDSAVDCKHWVTFIYYWSEIDKNKWC